MAGRILLVLAAFAVLFGCGQASSPAQKQENQGGGEEVAPATEPAKGSVGEPVDVGSATILVPKAFKTENNPKLGSSKYEGTFLIVEVTYTPDGKRPVKIIDPPPLTLKDSEGRSFRKDEEQGIAGYYASEKDLELAELGPTVNPGVPWETVVAFPIAPDASGFTLTGADLACPQCGKFFEIDLGF